MKELSIFIDESGDFGDPVILPSYYLVTLVFHDQEEPIFSQIHQLEASTHNAGFDLDYIHTGPLIRRDEVFNRYSIDDRRKLMYKILNFMNSVPILHETIAVNRKNFSDRMTLIGRLSRELSQVLFQYRSYFFSFEHILVYYDNGQRDLGAILNAVFSSHFSNVEFRKAEPTKYRLLQVADFVCSMELLKIKKQEQRLSESEKKFFYKPQELKKTFFKSVDRKNIHNNLNAEP